MRSAVGPGVRKVRSCIFLSVCCLLFLFGQDAAGKQSKQKGGMIQSGSIAIPKSATDVNRNSTEKEIRFTAKLSLTELTEFYNKYFEKKAWNPDAKGNRRELIQVLKFKKRDKSIRVELKSDNENGSVKVKIDGTGINWKKAKKEALGFDVSNFPLLDNQSKTRDGSTELAQFNSRKPVQENIKHFETLMKSKGWRLAVNKKKDSVVSLRFEKEGRFIRIGLWPHSFSDNSGNHQGTGGAITGTGLYWSGRQGIANVPQRMVEDMGKMTKLPDDKKQILIEVFKRKIEAVMTGKEGNYRRN